MKVVKKIKSKKKKKPKKVQSFRDIYVPNQKCGIFIKRT